DDERLPGRLCVACQQRGDRSHLCPSGGGGGGRRPPAGRRTGKARRRARRQAPDCRCQRQRARFLQEARLHRATAQYRAARRRVARQYHDGEEDREGEGVMDRPDTPFPRHWLYYIVLKIVLIAGAVALALKYFGFW